MKWSFQQRWSIYARHLRTHPAPRYFYEYLIFNIICWMGCVSLLPLAANGELGWCVAVQIVAASCAAITCWIVLCDLAQEWRTRREINFFSLLHVVLTPLVLTWIVGACYFVPWIWSLFPFGG